MCLVALMPISRAEIVETESVSFRLKGPLAVSASSGYLMSKVPMDQLLIKLTLHEMMVTAFEKFCYAHNVG